MSGDREGTADSHDESPDDPPSEAGAGDDPEPAPDVAALGADHERLRSEFEEFRDDVESRSVDRDAIEADLRRYVRWRQRRGYARNWGPYVVLLYGTGMTVGAFYLLDGGWAIGAMVVIWLSTLGLYVLMLLAGWGLGLLGLLGGARNVIGRRRDR